MTLLDEALKTPATDKHRAATTRGKDQKELIDLTMAFLEKKITNGQFVAILKISGGSGYQTAANIILKGYKDGLLTIKKNY